MSRRGVLSGLAAMLAVSSLAPRVAAGDQRVTGPEASIAARVAIAYVRGEWATIVRPGAPGFAWQFRVVRRDGSVTDVLLDERLELVDVGDSPSFATGYRANPSTMRLAQAPRSAQPTRVRAGELPVPQPRVKRAPSHATENDRRDRHDDDHRHD